MFALTFLLIGCASYVPRTPAQVPVLALSATAFDFKTVVIGQTAKQILHLTNAGTAPLRISAISVTGKDFDLSGPSVPRVILPNMSLDYSLVFAPTGAGNLSAALVIQSNANTHSTSVSLAGTGEKILAALQVNPPSVNFGNLTLQSTSTKNVTLTNSGDVNLTISGVTVVGGGFGFSDLSPGFSLSPNQQLTFQVWFKPQVKGSASATVSILSANLSSPASLSLLGDGVSPSSPPPATVHTVHLTWNPSSGSFIGYRVYRGAAAGGPFTVISTGDLTANSFVDTAVTNGTTYYYVVTAYDAAGLESPYSNEATAAIPAS